jgi:hypothetical protein
MVEISEKSHIPILISSLDKAFNQGLLGRKIYTNDLYLLDIIYNLLNGCCLELSNSERKILIDLYYKLYLKSKQICPAPIINQYQLTPKNKFLQAEKGDCCDFDLGDKIFYWQEDSLTSNINNILPLVDDTDYLDDKNYDTYEVFNNGKEIPYTNIGRIVFLTLGSYDANFKIYDIDNNDITEQFNIEIVPAINSKLFVSLNVFSHGNIKFKIKKI